MGSLRRSMSRSSLRYRTATFPRSPAKFSSMVNIRSSLKLHRRSKTQGDSEGGQGDTLPRTPVPITNGQTSCLCIYPLLAKYIFLESRPEFNTCGAFEQIFSRLTLLGGAKSLEKLADRLGLELPDSLIFWKVRRDHLQNMLLSNGKKWLNIKSTFRIGY